MTQQQTQTPDPDETDDESDGGGIVDASVIQDVLHEVEQERIQAHRNLQSAQEARNGLVERFNEKLETLGVLKQKFTSARNTIQRYEDRDEVSPQQVDEIRRQQLADLREDPDVNLDEHDLPLPDFEQAQQEVEDSADSTLNRFQERRQQAEQRIQEARQEAGQADEDWNREARLARAAGVNLDPYWTPDEPLPAENASQSDAEGGGE